MGYINSGKELTSLWVHKEMQSTEGTTVMEDTTKNTGTTLYSEGLNTQERASCGDERQFEHTWEETWHNITHIKLMRQGKLNMVHMRRETSRIKQDALTLRQRHGQRHTNWTLVKRHDWLHTRDRGEDTQRRNRRKGTILNKELRTRNICYKHCFYCIALFSIEKTCFAEQDVKVHNEKYTESRNIEYKTVHTNRTKCKVCQK